ncbi:MAG TPA: FAD-dependent monooxygenase [Vicinamibacterales bacterium]|nr:FAD-dependent monooxygenase [Vicinamibacterales bacterium]
MKTIVIGAGIGGLTTALALKQKGLDVDVYERSPVLTDVGAGISLWPNALKALYQLGLRPALDGVSFVSMDGAVRNSDGTVLSRTTADQFIARLGLPVVVFHRADLLAVLVDAARDIAIHTGHEARDVEQDAGGVTVRFANGAGARGDVLIGADGLRSVVRDRLGVPGALKYSGYTAWRGIAPFETAGLMAGETLGSGQRFGLAPIHGNRVYWYATDNVNEGQREPPIETKTRLMRLFGDWHQPIPELIRSTAEDTILRNDIYDRDPAERWGSGRITLLGDAAHPMTPNLGQGACQAIEDALVLSHLLSTGPDVPSSLRRYESERIPRTRSIVNASRRVGALFQVDSRAFCWLRNLGLRMMPVEMTYRSLKDLGGYEGHLNR